MYNHHSSQVHGGFTMYTRIVDRNVYYVDEEPYNSNIKCVHTEQGWYVELSFSDGGHDVYGPYYSKEEASNVF